MTEDTPAQIRALHSNPIARKVRARFPKGQRVETSGGAKGHVRRHVPALTSLGGVLLVEWENPVFGVTVGRVVPTTANVWPIDENAS